MLIIMDKVFISIGSNLGDKEAYCRKAVEEIAAFSDIVKLSSLYETEPVDNQDQPNFINAAAEISTDYSPHDLLCKLNIIEKKLGRVRSEKYGPRTIDLDIIFYGDLIIEDDILVIPHPRAHLRKFVLAPICEIAPLLIFPGFGASISVVLHQIKDKGNVLKLHRPFTVFQQ